PGPDFNSNDWAILALTPTPAQIGWCSIARSRSKTLGPDSKHVGQPSDFSARSCKEREDPPVCTRFTDLASLLGLRWDAGKLRLLYRRSRVARLNQAHRIAQSTRSRR